jgi:integrase
MALFKRKYTKVDPKTGKKIIDPKTGRPKQFLTDKWYGQYRDLSGHVHRVPLATDKVAAQQMLADLVKKAERRQAGVTDPFEQHVWRPLGEHVDDYESSIVANERTERYAGEVAQKLRAMVEGCEFQFISDINPDKLSRWLAEQRETRPRFGIGTTNHYITAMAAFCAWLSDPKKGRRCAINPFGKALTLNQETDVRRPRRILSDDEIAWLLDSTESGPVVGEMSGPDRAMLYGVGLMTGLRASELKSLSPESFDLAGDPATVTVEAAYSKHRRKDVLPLHPDLVARLRVWLAKRAVAQADAPAILSLKGTPASSVERLWMCAAVKQHRTADTLRRDLKAARERWIEAAADESERKTREGSDFLKYRTREGYADFHALRHSFITRVMDSGALIHHAQGLARHASIKQTEEYTHTRRSQLAQAMQQVPSLPAQSAASAKSAAVG